MHSPAITLAQIPSFSTMGDSRRGDFLVSGLHHLVRGGQIDPYLESMAPTTTPKEVFVRLLTVDYATARSHPLNIAGIQFTGVSCTVFVSHPPI